MSKDTIFTHVNALSSSKEYTYDEDRKALYQPYVVNKAFAQHVDTVLIANEVNSFHNDLTPEMHYDFYYHVVPKKKRYGWKKRTKNEELMAVARYYKLSFKKAEEYMKILDDKDIKRIVKIYNEVINNDNKEGNLS